MKKSLLLGAVFGVMAVPAAFAADAPMSMPVVDPVGGGYSGFVEISVNASTYNYDSEWGEEYNPWVGFGAAGALAYQIDDSMSVGVDMRTWSAIDGYENEYTTYGTQAALHLNFLSGNASYGGFVGVIAHNDYYSAGTDYDAIGGLEGKLAVTDDVLLSGQVGIVHQLSGYYEMGTVGFGSAQVSFFPTDNVMLSAGLGAIIGQVGDDSDETAQTLTYNLEAAYQFDDSPISVFARVGGYQDFDYWQSEGAASGTTVAVGARFAFDGESLKSTASKTNTVQDLSALSWLRLDAW